VLYKSCRDLQHKSIVPTHLPYVVSLVRFYETDSAIYLQLQHAAGGRLWSYVGAYLNQCIDAAANVYCNVELPPPTGSRLASAKKDCLKSDRFDSDKNLAQFPDSADSFAELTSATCPEFGEVEPKSKLSSSDVDSIEESCKPDCRKVSTASAPECLSQGFSEVLRSSDAALTYFRIDSCDSSEHASRQVSCSSGEANFCHIHSTAMSSGICRFCSEAETPRPVTQSDSGIDKSNETSIYDTHHSETVDNDTQAQEAVGSVHKPDNSADDGTRRAQRVEVDKSRYPSVRSNSQECSLDNCNRRRRRRTLSSAFGELDLAESTVASGAAPPRPLVHLPESCVQQWAAEMVVAISRLHSIGIICRQVDLCCSCFDLNYYFSALTLWLDNRWDIRPVKVPHQSPCGDLTVPTTSGHIHSLVVPNGTTCLDSNVPQCLPASLSLLGYSEITVFLS